MTKPNVSPDFPALPAANRPKAGTNWRRSVLAGYVIIFGALGSFGAWASFARLDGAAIAGGVVAAESNRKTIQHLEGGIVQEILVRDGDRVRANQLLVRLDPTRIETQGDLYRNQFAILLAQEARLLAEFEGRDALVFPDAVMQREHDKAVQPVIADQRRLFDSRRSAVLRNTQIADAQIEQVNKELEQLAVDVETARATLVQIDSELGQLRPLYQRQLVPTTRIAPLERELLRLQGVINGNAIQVGKLKEKLAETMLRRQQVLQDYRQEASSNLIDVRRQLTDVRQQVLLVNDSERRAEIRAPIDGTVQQLKIFTVGGVVRAGEPIMEIAPENDELVIRAKVHPNDIDRVAIGMASEIRFPGFNYWGTEVIRGTIRAISRDRIVEDNGRDIYFAAEIIVNRATVPAEILPKLSAGMSAEAIISTGERTVAAYLLHPLTERWNGALRER